MTPFCRALDLQDLQGFFKACFLYAYIALRRLDRLEMRTRMYLEESKSEIIFRNISVDSTEFCSKAMPSPLGSTCSIRADYHEYDDGDQLS